MSSKTTKQINKITGAVILISIRVVLIAVIIVVAGNGIKLAYDFGHSIFYAQAVEEAPGHDVTITIPEGADEKDAATLLKNKGLIDNKYQIIVQAKFFDYEVKPGTYTLNTSQTSREILKQLNDGPPEEEQNISEEMISEETISEENPSEETLSEENQG